MKHYKGWILSFLLIGCGSYFTVGKAVVSTYDIKITTKGDNALVEAIQQYSNITPFDVVKWKFSWAPYLGDYMRDGVITKIRNFIKVCQSIKLASERFPHALTLINAFPGHWKPKAICLALKNLEKQAEDAATLLSQVGVRTTEEKSWEGQNGLIDIYLKNIQHNRAQFNATCTGIKLKKAAKIDKKLRDEQRLLQQQQNRAAADILYWENWRRKWKMAKDVGKNVFGGAKWMANTAYNMSVEQPGMSLLSAAALYYFYNKLFGTNYPIKK